MVLSHQPSHDDDRSAVSNDRAQADRRGELIQATIVLAILVALAAAARLPSL